MRSLMGGLVLVLGVAGLGYWGANSYSGRIEGRIGAAADAIADGTMHKVTVSTEGRDITLSGLVNDEDERRALLTAMHAVEGRRVVRDDLRTLPFQSPYRTTIIKFPSGELRLGGSVPQEKQRVALKESVSIGQDGTDLASGAPADWLDLTQRAAKTAAELNEGQVTLQDRTIIVEGILDTPRNLDAALDAFGVLPDDVALNTDGVTLLDDGKPAVFTIVWDDQGTARATGKLPQGVADFDLAEALGIASITGDAAPGLVNSEDGPAALLGAIALTELENGTLRFEGKTLLYAGQARDPSAKRAVEQTLSELPSLYTVDTRAIKLRDDGTAPAFDLELSASDGASVSGKLPEGLELAEMADALGLNAVAGEPVLGLTGPDQKDGVLAFLEHARDVLGVAEYATVTRNDGAAGLNIGAVAGTKTDVLARHLAEVFRSGTVITVAIAESTNTDGDLRTNTLSGAQERFFGGHWILELAFAADAETCAAQSQDVLARAKVNFLSGSAELDPLSVASINQIAGVVARCVADGGLQGEIGGHTDSTGDVETNTALSVARADVVREALVARGVDATGLTAVGYGPSQPIADNETDEGRAANRRTTIIWSQAAQ